MMKVSISSLIVFLEHFFGLFWYLCNQKQKGHRSFYSKFDLLQKNFLLFTIFIFCIRFFFVVSFKAKFKVLNLIFTKFFKVFSFLRKKLGLKHFFDDQILKLLLQLDFS